MLTLFWIGVFNRYDGSFCPSGYFVDTNPSAHKGSYHGVPSNEFIVVEVGLVPVNLFDVLWVHSVCSNLTEFSE